MVATRLPAHRRVRSVSIGLICAGCFCGGLTAHPAESPDEAFLNALAGSWTMVGTVGSKPVRYRTCGQRVLQGGFVELHMIEAGPPPHYEADFFIGFDPKVHDYIGHWLDRFGAAGARVVATGKRIGDELVMTFPYAEGPFRDTFIWRPATASWSLLIESGTNGGTWSTFASYTLSRPPPAAKHWQAGERCR